MEHTQWQSLLTCGNECFQAQQWGQAEAFYSEAYDTLFDAYRNNPLSADLLMAWICTCHNLSSLHEAQQNFSLALQFLMIPNDYLNAITQSNIPDEATKLLAYQSLSLTFSPILMFTKKYPICDDCRSKTWQRVVAHNRDISNAPLAMH